MGTSVEQVQEALDNATTEGLSFKALSAEVEKLSPAAREELLALAETFATLTVDPG